MLFAWVDYISFLWWYRIRHSIIDSCRPFLINFIVAVPRQVSFVWDPIILCHIQAVTNSQCFYLWGSFLLVYRRDFLTFLSLSATTRPWFDSIPSNFVVLSLFCRLLAGGPLSSCPAGTKICATSRRDRKTTEICPNQGDDWRDPLTNVVTAAFDAFSDGHWEAACCSRCQITKINICPEQNSHFYGMESGTFSWWINRENYRVLMNVVTHSRLMRFPAVSRPAEIAFQQLSEDPAKKWLLLSI